MELLPVRSTVRWKTRRPSLGMVRGRPTLDRTCATSFPRRVFAWWAEAGILARAGRATAPLQLRDSAGLPSPPHAAAAVTGFP